MCEKTDRRCFLARGVLGAAGVGAVHSSIENNILLAAMQDGTAQARENKKPKTDIPPGSLQCGKIGKVSISRLLIGGNLIGGWAHGRDLMYTDKLFKSYNTEAKIFETLEIAQDCGINAIQIDASAWDTVLKYNKQRTTKLQVIANPGLNADKAKMNEEIKRLVDLGATLLYPHGRVTDAHFMNGGKIDVLGQAVDLIKAQGVPAGVGCHSLNVVVTSEKNKINPNPVRHDGC